MAQVKEVDSLVYHQTLVESSATVALCYGSFSRPSFPQEVIRVYTDSIELCRLDMKFNCLNVISRLPLFATVHCAVTVPYPSLSGSSTFVDSLALTSDSGTLTLMRYELPNAAAAAGKDSLGEWVVLDTADLGRSGTRVTGPGHYLRIDCRSQALLVAAPLKDMRIFPLLAGEGDERGTLKFKSPLSCPNHAVIFDCCGVEVPPEQNSLFAVLESENLLMQSTSRAEFQEDQGPSTSSVEKFVSFYEYSPSLNVVNRMANFRVSHRSHAIIPVPCDSGPGGILICSDQDVLWESLSTRTLAAAHSMPPVKVDFPRRSDLPLSQEEPMIIAHAITKLQKRFFLLLQNELGDLFRVEVSQAGVQHHFRLGRSRGETGAPVEAPLTVRYFDTIPPCTQMALFKKGYLLSMSEAACHGLYRVIGDGSTSNTNIKRVKMPAVAPPAAVAKTGRATLAIPNRFVTLFQRHFNAKTKTPELRNLLLVQSLPNSAETLSVFASLDAQQRLRFVRLGGRSGQHSTLHTVRYGLSTTFIRSVDLHAPFDVVIPLLETASLFPTPGEDPAPSKTAHSRILVSSGVGTLVLLMGNDLTVDSSSGFINTVPTLAAATIAEGRGYVQVHPRGVSLVGRAHGEPPFTWTHPQQRSIIAADCNAYQVVVGIDNGGLMSFDFGLTGAQFNVTCTQPTAANVKAVSIAPRVGSSGASEFVAVASMVGFEVSFLHCKTLKVLDTLRCPVEVTSILLTTLDLTGLLMLFVGLCDGRLLKLEADGVTGKRLSTAAFACGSFPTKLVKGGDASYCLVASSEVWRCYTVDGAFRIAPVLVPPNSLTRETCVAAALRADSRFQLLLQVSGRYLTVSTVQVEDNTSSLYSETTCALHSVTGRRLLAHPTRPNVYVAMCTEYRGYNPQDQQLLVEKLSDLPLEVAMSERSPNVLFKHVSCIHVFDAASNVVLPALYMNDGETAVSMAIGSLVKDFGKDPVLVVGCANNYSHGHGVRAPSWSEASLRTYRFATAAAGAEASGLLQAAPRLELVHATLLEHGDLPSAVHIATAAGCIFVGFGPSQGLHMYSWGLKHLLWKRKLVDTFRSRIITLDSIQDTTTGSRLSAAGYGPGHCAASATTLVLCGLQDQSVALVRHMKTGNATHFLMCVAVDPMPRFVVASCFIDDRTIAVSDRFGSLVILRVPPETRFDLPESLDSMSDAELMHAVSFRQAQPLQVVNAFHVGQVVTSLQVISRPPVVGVTTAPVPVLVYGTILGKIGGLVPFSSEEDAALAAYLDPILQEFFHSPLDRSLLQHRSRMTPKLRVVDGDSLQLLAQSKQVFLTTEAKLLVEERVEKFRNVEATHRKLLNLPARQLTSIHELTSKMKALLGLSE